MFLKESHVGGQQSTSQSEKFYSDINVGPVGWDLSPARFVASKRPRDTLTALSHSCAPVAQRLEQQTHNLLVRGSNPCGGTKRDQLLQGRRFDFGDVSPGGYARCARSPRGSSLSALRGTLIGRTAR